MQVQATVSKQQKREQSTAHIMDAALELFMTKGFHQTTVEEIAVKAGLAPATIYYYFGTKEKLAMAIGAHYLNDLTRYEMTIINQGESIRERIHHLVRHFFAWMHDHPLAGRFINSPDFFGLVESVGLPEPCHIPGEAITRLIEEGQALGEVRQLPAPLLSWAMRIPVDAALAIQGIPIGAPGGSPSTFDIAEMIWRAIRSDAAAIRDLGCGLARPQP